jgi:acyl-coenzyme A thioesterase PaaI-like protein
MRVDGDRILGACALRPTTRGAPGFAHGGAVAAVLDDALGSVLLIVGRLAVTANLNIDYRLPALLDRDLVIEARCERIEGRRLHLAARLLDGEHMLAEAHALFIEVDMNHFRQSGRALPEPWGHWQPDDIVRTAARSRGGSRSAPRRGGA